MKIYTAVEQFSAFKALASSLDAAEKRVDAARVELSKLGETRAQAEADYYRQKYTLQAKYLSQMSAAAARIRARANTADEHEDFKLAEVREAAAREALWQKRELVRDIRQKMSNFQSVGSMARTEAELSGKLGET